MTNRSTARAALLNPPATDGFFAPDSVVRRVHREAVVYAAGPRALLLQFAHPKVAAGLREHGELETAPVRRLLRTFRSMDAMLFGDHDEAVRASRRTTARHALVRGVLRESVGRYRAGDAYSATEPELLLWVLATLIDSSLLAYETFVAPLAPSDRERYYQEIVKASPLLGLSPEQMPASFPAFKTWFEEVLAGDTLVVGEDGRVLASSLLDRDQLGLPLAVVARTLASAMLPERLRSAYELPWASGAQATAFGFRLAARTFTAVAPRRLREARPWSLGWKDAHAADPGCPVGRPSRTLRH